MKNYTKYKFSDGVYITREDYIEAFEINENTLMKYVRKGHIKGRKLGEKKLVRLFNIQ